MIIRVVHENEDAGAAYPRGRQRVPLEHLEAHESAPKNYLIRNVHPLTMHRYPGMGEDVERELREFVAFARQHLPERFNAERAAA